MTNQSHTPGPWHVGYWQGQCHIDHSHGVGKCKYDYTIVRGIEWADNSVCAGDKDNPITIISGKEELEEFDIPNARLIAAAPELLEACEAIMKARDSKLIEVDGPYHQALNSCDKAITKATGKEKQQ